MLAEIARQMNWKYLSIISDQHNQEKAEQFQDETIRREICVAKHIRVGKILDSKSNQKDAAENWQKLVRKLVLVSGSRAVYVFASGENVKRFFDAILTERVPAGRFMFVMR